MLKSYHSKRRCYTELVLLKTFEERFDYLKLVGVVGEATFGYDRYLNQALYCSSYWKRIRNNVILRDGACDLGIKGYDLYGNITVHHMNPITMDMINDRHEYVANEEYLICVSFDTHNAIHFGSRTGADITSKWKIIERTPNDTIPWR